MRHSGILCFIFLAVLYSSAQNKDKTTNQQTMEERGNQGMGFDQEKITHHFLLTKDGGVIQVTVNSPDDKTSIDQIRMHLEHIAGAFASGDFDIPMFVHDQTPPGVSVLKRLRKKLVYKVELIDSGGRVAIRTANAQARQAVWDFLRFQITEHKTGDSLKISVEIPLTFKLFLADVILISVLRSICRCALPGDRGEGYRR